MNDKALTHRRQITWWFERLDDREISDEEKKLLDEHAMTRVSSQIEEGYTCGELFVSMDDADYRGWWSLQDAPRPVDRDREGESYGVLALSTAHLTEGDVEALNRAAEDKDNWMVMAREPGFFIKLYAGETPGDTNPENLKHGESGFFRDIVRYAETHGYQMVEFDRDAPVMDRFPVFDIEDAPRP